MIQEQPKDLKEWKNLAIHQYLEGDTEEYLKTMNQIVQEEMSKKQYDTENDISTKVQILNSFAVYYLDQSSKENDKKKKQDLIDIVTQFINKSDRININESISFCLKGFLLFFNSDFKKAGEYFSQSLEFDSQFYIASIGKGSLEYVKGNYLESAENFKSVWKQNPNHVNAKLSLAYNFYQLEKYDLAIAIFQHVYEQDSNNIQAIIGLAIVYYRQNDKQLYREMLNKAFLINDKDVQLLILLAEYFQFNKDYDRMLKVSAVGIKELQKWPRFEKSSVYCGFHEIKSKFLFFIGLYYHNKEQQDALKYYKEAIQMNHKNFQAQYNLAKVYISEKNYIAALKCMETIINNNQNNQECYKILGYLYSKNQNRQQAVKYYKLAQQFEPEDYENLIEYANIQEHFDVQESLQAYEKAEMIMSKLEIQIHPELLNNIGVLTNKLGKYQQSHEAFDRALQLLKQDENQKNLPIKNTILFNLACLFEDMSKFGDANEIYKQIANDNPYYIDAQLKIVYLQFQRGSLVKALDTLDKAIKIIEVNKLRPDLAICLKGFIQFELGDEYQARVTIDRLKRNFNMDDPFAKVFNAKIEYQNSVELRAQQTQNHQILRKLIDQGREILQKDEFNCQAANIIAIVFSELRYFKEAREIFNQLMETSPNNLHILINMAHLEFLQGNFENAKKIYSNYLGRKQTRDEYVEMCVVCCYYQLKNWDQAIKQLKRIVLNNPESLQYRYNLNVLIHQYSQSVLDQKVRQQEQTKQSIKYLQNIQSMYEHLYKNHNARNSRLSLQKCEQGKKKAIQLMEKIRDSSENQYNYIIQNQSRYEQLQKEDRQQIYEKYNHNQKIMEAYQTIQNKKLLEEQKKLQEEQKQKLIEQELAQKNQEQALKILEQFQLSQQQNQKKSNRGKKQKEIEYEDEKSIHNENIDEIFEDQSEEEIYQLNTKNQSQYDQTKIKKKSQINLKRKSTNDQEVPKKKKLKKLNQIIDEPKDEDDFIYDQVYHQQDDDEDEENYELGYDINQQIQDDE